MRPWILAAVLAPSLAWANGRAPLTNGVYLRPGDDHALYVRSTFGLLVSHDDGCSFRWVCEKAIGYGGEFDPKYAVAADGTIFATTFTGLRVSRDGGCTWATATAELPVGTPGRIADLWIDALDLGPDGTLWVATAESAGTNNVYRSTDNGVTFTPGGLPSATIWWKSIEVARSQPQRIYVTGYQVAQEARAHLYRSDDGGGGWTEQPLPADLVFGAPPLVLVAAVDPADPDHLLLTSVGANPPSGDRLYRSTDGGGSFVEVLATTDAVRDVVFRKDGSVLVATLAGGTFEARGAQPFTRLGATSPNSPDVQPPRLGCIAERPGGELIGCGANWQPDFMAVGRATDPLAWQKLFRFVELAGPLACPAGTTTQELCAPMWPALQQQFAATGPPETCGGAMGPVDGPPPMPRKDGGAGCCDASGASTGGLALFGIGALVLARRRRAAHSSASRSRQLG